MAKIYNNSKKHKVLYYPKAKTMGKVNIAPWKGMLMGPYIASGKR